MIRVGDRVRRRVVVHRVEYLFPDGVVFACSVRRYPPDYCEVVAEGVGPLCRKARCWPTGTLYGPARVPPLPEQP